MPLPRRLLRLAIAIAAVTLACASPLSRARDAASAPSAAAKDSDWRTPVQKIVRDVRHIQQPAGIEETRSVQIGGITQWISVRGHDRRNPILLFIHGGPASTEMPVSWPAAEPFCCNVLTFTAPLESANWVMPYRSERELDVADGVAVEMPIRGLHPDRSSGRRRERRACRMAAFAVASLVPREKHRKYMMLGEAPTPPAGQDAPGPAIPAGPLTWD